MSMFGNFKLAEKRYPTRADLDSAAPEHPVYCLASMHTRIANSYALESANITRETARNLEGAEIELDEATGEPTGVLVECHDLLPAPQLTYEEMKETLKQGIPEHWLKQGFTSAYSFCDAQEIRVYQDLLSEGDLPLRVRIMPCDLANSPEYIENMSALGILPGMGNEWLKMGGVKIFVDGAFMTLSAASCEPYLNMPRKDHCGILRHNARALNDLVLKAHNAGLQLCIHAMGDKAQNMALDAVEKALAQNPRPHRHRIEHFGCDMGSPELRTRAKALGIIPVVTTGWLYAYGDFIAPYLGPDRRDQSFALRSMIETGLKVANSSDQCGTERVTLDPFFSIWCAVTRQTYCGNRFVPDEAITVNEALRLWTTNAAYSGFEEEIKGSIEPGKVADLIVISQDILTVPEDEIRDIQAEMTIIDGKIVYEK
jgi:predicted amidohydrolase YtcJ